MGEGLSPVLPRAPALHGLALPPDRVGQLAAARGFPVWPAAPLAPAASLPPASLSLPQAAPHARVIVLLGSTSSAIPPSLWQPPHAAWIDTTGLDDQAVLNLIDLTESHSLYCSVTSASAHQLPLASGLVMALDGRWELSQTSRNDIELALHEAITNALIHGNLEIDGLRDLSVAALEQFADGLAGRVSDPAYAGRRIEISCRIAEEVATFEIVDQGPGFVPIGGSDSAAGGRGLALIEALSLSYQLLDGGRRIRMRLALT